MTGMTSGEYGIRSVRADEWRAVKELRLAALRDPVAHLAFLETYEQAAVKADAFWQDRAAGSAEGSTGVRQIIAEEPGGSWAGTLTVRLEEAGTTDWAGLPVERRQGHVVGVFVRPGHRGTGLAEALFEAGAQWAWGRGAARVRLFVHEDNARAQAAYRKAGFVPSGVVVTPPQMEGQRELEFVRERA